MQRHLLPVVTYLTISTTTAGLGEITVRVSRIDQDTTGNDKCRLKLRSTLRESSLFNSLWYGECLLAGE